MGLSVCELSVWVSCGITHWCLKVDEAVKCLFWIILEICCAWTVAPSSKNQSHVFCSWLTFAYKYVVRSLAPFTTVLSTSPVKSTPAVPASCYVMANTNVTYLRITVELHSTNYSQWDGLYFTCRDFKIKHVTEHIVTAFVQVQRFVFGKDCPKTCVSFRIYILLGLVRPSGKWLFTTRYAISFLLILLVRSLDFFFCATKQTIGFLQFLLNLSCFV